MSAAVLGQIVAAVAGFLALAVSLWTEQRRQRKRANDAIAKRDRDELRAGMARIDELRAGADQTVPPGPPPQL
jgi:Flp pilus assembly protein TadB